MNDWLGEFKALGAVWMHGGSPRAPHALLTSGLHSNGFVNTTAVTSLPRLVDRILQASDGLSKSLPKESEVDWVVGSAMGAVTFAHAVALRVGCRAGYTEKDGDAMALVRFSMSPDNRVLLVEDVLTTGGSTLKTHAAVAKTGVKVLPFMVTIVNRSGKKALETADVTKLEIRALVTLDIQNWRPEDCPLCRAGSTALRPKSHWSELLAGAR